MGAPFQVDLWLEPPRAGFPDQSERAFERNLDRGSRDQDLGTPANEIGRAHV